ncbi:hypothetical protein [Paraburkholderia elongata]|nr:hypothetical protein [Paraburkholderia elongata]
MFGQRIPFDGRGALVFVTMLIICYVYAFTAYLLFEQNAKRMQRGIRQFRFLRNKPDPAMPHS